MRAVLRAEVAADLRSVRGTLEVDDPAVHPVDLLVRLPLPADDLVERRTFPGRVRTGRIELEAAGPGRWRFLAHLPDRAGAAGRVPGRGLFADGLWHPALVDAAGAPVAPTWDAEVALPAGSVGALLDAAGSGTLRWAGRSDRLGLAVLPRGRLRRLEGKGVALLLLDAGPRRRRRDRLLLETAEAAARVHAPARPLVVVESPLWRRLARTAPGMVFLSDRAFRLTGPLARYHEAAVRRALVAAAVDAPEAWARGLAAAWLDARAGLPPRDPRRLLGWFAWIPQVDAVLYDGTLPFHAETFDEPWPDDPLADDPAELLAPSRPPRVALRTLRAEVGEAATDRFASALAAGLPVEEAAREAGIPGDRLAAIRRLPPPVALSAEAERADGGWVVRLRREAPPGAPPEWVDWQVDDDRGRWRSAGPTDVLAIPRPARPRRVVVDPDHAVRTEDRADDAWPRPWTAVASVFPYELDVARRRLSAEAALVLRPRYGSRGWLLLTGETSTTDLAAAAATWVHAAGPLLDRRTRPLHLWAGLGAALLDPAYRPVAGGGTALEASAGLSWDDRVDPELPRRGRRAWLAGDGGLVPGGDAWWALRAGGARLWPVGGRLVLASRASAGLARGGVEHRLLDLGGSGAVEGLPPGTAIGTARLLGTGELRWEALRQVSVPLPLSWLSGLQLSGGADLGWLRAEDAGSVAALGWRAGAAVLVDALGARPSLLGAWLAGPAAVPADLAGGPRLYVRMLQPF